MTTFNGKNGGSWWSKIATEAIRLGVVGIAGLAIAYWGLGLQVNHVSEKINANCQNSARLKTNQKIVLFTLLDLLDTVGKATHNHPPSTHSRIEILTAIANLPVTNC